MRRPSVNDPSAPGVQAFARSVAGQRSCQAPLHCRQELMPLGRAFHQDPIRSEKDVGQQSLPDFDSE